jgi:hypothetical protein
VLPVWLERAASHDLLLVLLLSGARSLSRLSAEGFTDYRRSAVSTGRVMPLERLRVSPWDGHPMESYPRCSKEL